MNALRKSIKSKSLLINKLKINNKSLEILDSFLTTKSITNNNMSNSSRNKKILGKIYNKKFQFTSRLFFDKNLYPKILNSISTVNSERSLPTNSNYIKSLTERNNNNILNILSKNNKKFISRNEIMQKNKELNDPYFSLSQQNLRSFYTININKYKTIFENVSLRIKSSYQKKKNKLNNKENKNHIRRKSTKTTLKTERSPLKKRNTKSNPNNNKSEKSNFLSDLEQYENTLENEFNCRELIKMDNSKILQQLKQLKRDIYHKTPLYKTTEKLNKHLIRQYNLDNVDLINAFNRKYKVYRQSVNKIQEARKENISHQIKKLHTQEEKNYSTNKEEFDYNKNNDKKEIITNKNVKKALKNYYNQKAKHILMKKLELERELIDLNTKFKAHIEKEKYIKNAYNINYGQLNQIIQSKLINRDIYETNINKKKKEFYDEHTEMLHKIRNWSIPRKIVKTILKQKTINEYKKIMGVYFGYS
jgi:hypothetical protein